MAPPARQRILDAAARLLREKGVGKLTTREIAEAADAAEGSITKNFGGKLGLLTALMCSELPELASWRAALPPPGAGPVREKLIEAADAAVAFYRASLPLVAGAVSDSELFARYRSANAERSTGPQVAVEEMRRYLVGCQKAGTLRPDADPAAIALAYCGAAQLEAWTEYLSGPAALPGERTARLAAVVDLVLA